MTRKRDDVHRRAAIKPEDYEYAGFLRVYKGQVAHESDEGTAEKLRASSRVGLRAYGEDEIGRCDHCGARLKNVSVWLHTPTGGHIAVGETCAKETLQVPDRMILDIKRLADWRAGVERPRTPEEWREYRLKEARHAYPETLEFLRAVLDGSVGKQHPWWEDASVDDRLFIGKLARGHDETGRISERVVAVVREKEAATLERKRRIAAGHQHAPVGYDLTIEGVVAFVGEHHDGWKLRHVMTVEGDEGWTVEATVPRRLVLEEGWDTRYAFEEGDRVRFGAKEVERSYRDPYVGLAKHPKQVELLGDEEVERLRMEKAHAARLEAEAQALLREGPWEPEVGDAPAQRSRYREGSMDALREQARRLGMDFGDLLRAEERAGRVNAKPGRDR